MTNEQKIALYPRLIEALRYYSGLSTQSGITGDLARSILKESLEGGATYYAGLEVDDETAALRSEKCLGE